MSDQPTRGIEHRPDTGDVDPIIRHGAGRKPSLPTVGSTLAACGPERVDAEVLLAAVLGCNRAWLIAHADDALPARAAASFAALAARRREGEPVAYLTGRREFWGLSLAVNASVLIPRPETETLVEVALSKLPADRPTYVLELGTGSGAIAVAVARERPLAVVLATDSAAAALDVARANVNRLGVSTVSFARGSWYEALAALESSGATPSLAPEWAASGFDLIASNPPYIADADPHLAQGDLRFEPRAALAAGPDGLDALRAIIAGAASHLAPGGWLVVEHGHDQARAVHDLLVQAQLRDFASACDLAGIVRVAAGHRAATS